MINQIKMTGGSSITIGSEQWAEIQEKLAGANSEAISLRTQLAKSNERVKELEGQLELTMLTTHEESFESDYGKRALNKFAIEKKSEALNAVKNEIKTVGGLELCDVVEFIDEKLEQLRKEQE